MRSIELLRHGCTVAGAGRYCGRSDVALSADGWAQMWRAVESRRWDRIVSSPLKRCAEFGKALAARLSIECEVDARWQELDFGDWENRRPIEIDADALARFWRDPDTHAPPGGERLDGLSARVRRAQQALRTSMTDEQRVLVVTHAGPMRVLLSAPDASAAELLGLNVPHAALRACPDDTV